MNTVEVLRDLQSIPSKFKESPRLLHTAAEAVWSPRSNPGRVQAFQERHNSNPSLIPWPKSSSF